MSASVVCQFDTDTRTAARPCHTVPPSQASPSACTPATTARVTSSSPEKRRSTWLSTTSLSTSTPGSASIAAASRRACAQQRSTRSATPARPSERSAAYTGTPRARRDISGT